VLTVGLKDRNEIWVTGPRGGSRLASYPSPDGIYFYGSGRYRRVVPTSQPAYPVNRCV
jgi:hypothetical protein